MFPTKNALFTAYCADAARYPQIWRLLAGLIMAIAVYAVVVIAFFLIPLKWDTNIIETINGEGSPLGTSMLLASFIGMAVGLALAARLFQKRGFRSLFGPDLGKVLRHFGMAVALVSVVLAVLSGVRPLLSPPVPNLPVNIWLIWLPLSLLLVLIQTGSEELFFRGYLQQQLAARFSSRWIWWVLPSALFALAHYDASRMGENASLVVFDTFLVGLLAADLTARTGTLGAAIGVHFVNNVMALLFVAQKGNISGLSLFVTPFAMHDSSALRGMLLQDIGITLVLYAIYLVVVHRRAR